MEILESLNYEKLAIFGGGKFLTDVAKAIILAMGKTDSTKLFPDREAAVAWAMAYRTKAQGLIICAKL